MTTIEKMIAYVTEICSDKRYYYSQNRKLYEGYAVDCSSLILRGISLGAGLPIGKATYTGNMVQELCNTGNFVCMPFDISKAQYVILPITFDGDKPTIHWRDSWSLDEFE